MLVSFSHFRLNVRSYIEYVYIRGKRTCEWHLVYVFVPVSICACVYCRYLTSHFEYICHQHLNEVTINVDSIDSNNEINMKNKWCCHRYMNKCTLTNIHKQTCSAYTHTHTLTKLFNKHHRKWEYNESPLNTERYRHREENTRDDATNIKCNRTNGRMKGRKKERKKKWNTLRMADASKCTQFVLCFWLSYWQIQHTYNRTDIFV